MKTGSKKLFVFLTVCLLSFVSFIGCQKNAKGKDADIKKGYIAVFSQGMGEFSQETYVYKASFGKYKYVNVKAATDGWGGPFIRTVVGSGKVDTKEELVEIAKENNACGQLILIPPEAYDKYDPAFIESKQAIEADYPQIYMTIDEFLSQDI
ncbi:MAG: hypothetical protein K5776_09505 [Lachnospiraceae bacterium]|nr:hypothetical protein [Lachnospiraceae bacterium]